MAIIRSVLRSQPRYPFRIAGSGLGASVCFAYNPAAGPVDLVSGAVGDPKSTTRAVTNLGLGYVSSAVTNANHGSGIALNANSSHLAFSGSCGLPSNTAPFTLSWYENCVGLTNPYPGLFQFSPPGSARPWGILRDNSNAVDAWESIVFGYCDGNTGVKVGGPATDLTPAVGRGHRIVIVGRAGMVSNTTTDYSVYYDGVEIATAASPAGGIGALTSTSQLIGFLTSQQAAEYLLADVVLFRKALSAAEVRDYFSNPYQVYAPQRRTIFIEPVVAGGTTHTTTGTLTGPSSTVAGTTAHLTLHATTGALTGPGSIVVGTAVHPHTTTGVLAGAGSTVAGTATHGAVHETTGALTGPGSTVVGTALHPHTTAGVLAGAGSTVVGAAERASPGIHPTTGVLAGAGSTVTGTAAHLALHATTGALTGPGASISGTATRLALHATEGILVAAGPTLAGLSAHTIAGAVAHDTSATLQGAGSAVAGVAGRFDPGVYGEPRPEKTVRASPDRIGPLAKATPRRIG